MVPSDCSSGRSHAREPDQEPPLPRVNSADFRVLDMDFEARCVLGRSASAADEHPEFGDQETCMQHIKNWTSPTWTASPPSPFPGLIRRAECKLPSLLSYKASDGPPNLELSLSLALEGSEPRRSSSACLSTVSDGPVKLVGAYPGSGPFPLPSVKVEEEPISSPPRRDELSMMRGLSPLTLPLVSSSSEKGTLDLFGEKLGMPSAQDQLAGACTIEKVQMALERTGKNRPAKKSCPVVNSLLEPTSSGKKRTSPSFSFLDGLSAKASPVAASSPTSSDSSSSVSCKSSLHSSGSGGYDSCSMPPSGSIDNRASQKVAPTTLVIMGCPKCQMYLMVSKDSRDCFTCGTVLQNLPASLPAPRKRQRVADA